MCKFISYQSSTIPLTKVLSFFSLLKFIKVSPSKIKKYKKDLKKSLAIKFLISKLVFSFIES